MFLDNCVAVAGAEFTSLSLDTTIIFDNDRRNKEVLRQIEKTIDRGYSVVLWPDDVKQKDINDINVIDTKFSDLNIEKFKF